MVSARQLVYSSLVRFGFRRRRESFGTTLSSTRNIFQLPRTRERRGRLNMQMMELQPAIKIDSIIRKKTQLNAQKCQK
jgi:hypothetical protein